MPQPLHRRLVSAWHAARAGRGVQAAHPSAPVVATAANGGGVAEAGAVYGTVATPHTTYPDAFGPPGSGVQLDADVLFGTDANTRHGVVVGRLNAAAVEEATHLPVSAAPTAAPAVWRPGGAAGWLAPVGDDGAGVGGAFGTPEGYREADIAGSVYGGSDPIAKLTRRLPGRHSDRAVQLFMFSLMRWAIPVLHAAIVKRRFLEGRLSIQSDDAGLRRALTEFWQSVPVGESFGVSGLRGGDVYLDMLSENADEAGQGFGEMGVSEAGLERLYVPHPRTFDYVREEGTDTEGGPVRRGYRLYQTTDGDRRAIESPHVQVLTFSPNPYGAGGRPLAWGLESTAEIILRMKAAANDLWFRSGSPTEIYTVEPRESETSSPPSAGDLKAGLDKLQGLIQQAHRARAEGYAANVFFGMSNGTVKRDTLGDNLITKSLAPYLRPHYATFVGEVVGNADVPDFLFPAGIVPGEGMNSDQAGRKAELALAAAGNRNATSREPLARGVLDTFLALEGATRFQGRYTLTHVLPPLMDPVSVADVAVSRADATDKEIGNAAALLEQGVLKTDADVLAYLQARGVVPS